MRLTSNPIRAEFRPYFTKEFPEPAPLLVCPIKSEDFMDSTGREYKQMFLCEHKRTSELTDDWFYFIQNTLGEKAVRWYYDNQAVIERKIGRLSHGETCEFKCGLKVSLFERFAVEYEESQRAKEEEEKAFALEYRRSFSPTNRQNLKERFEYLFPAVTERFGGGYLYDIFSSNSKWDPNRLLVSKSESLETEVEFQQKGIQVQEYSLGESRDLLGTELGQYCLRMAQERIEDPAQPHYFSNAHKLDVLDPSCVLGISYGRYRRSLYDHNNTYHNRIVVELRGLREAIFHCDDLGSEVIPWSEGERWPLSPSVGHSQGDPRDTFGILWHD